MRKIKLNDVQYSLEMNLGSLCKFQTETGLNPLDDKVLADIDPIKLRALLHATIQEEVKLQDLDKIKPKEFEKIMTTIMKEIGDDAEAKK